MKDNPDEYFKKQKVVNFDIIQHECRADPRTKSYEEHQTVVSEGLKKYPDTRKMIKITWCRLYLETEGMICECKGNQ